MYKNKVKRVCFHSSEIRNKQGPFRPQFVNHSNFINDITVFMDSIPMTIMSCTIDKLKHCRHYTQPEQPYNLSLVFILERFVKYFLKPIETGIIMLEARGKKEDAKILKHIKEIMNNGTRFVDKDDF